MIITLSEVILFFILVTLIAYYFIPWKKFTKAPFIKLLNFWVQSVMFAVILVGFAFPFSSVIVTIIGVVYPVWKSCEAVETVDTLEDDKQWLTYWCIFGFFSFFDNEKFIIIDLEYGNLFINKETLEHSVNNNITAKCELMKNQKSFFDLLNERKNKLNNVIN